ncbi:MAG: zinc carboxypeptidase [Erysipelotrichaceae bacterium]|nr:zinc carboxypeptidase [Erysipelotrichaceae bacterium]
MKTTFSYDHYYKYDELSNNLKQLSESYPELMSLEVNCVTEEGRNQYVAVLSNKKIGDHNDKPAFYLDGNIHAGEVTSSMCAMHTIDYLLSNYSDNEEVKDILDNYTLYVIPRVTPDGAETYLSTPYTLRSVNRDYIKEKGGIKEEDLDDDGVIRMMRIKTPYGAWKKDKNDPGLMVLRAPDDKFGDFYDIYPEGLLEEFEGDENLRLKKEDWGLDFNRNFPYGWYPEYRQEGAGDYPLSNIETKAIADFILAHQNICAAAIGHTSGGIILYPPGTKNEAKAPKEDIDVLKAIARMGEEELGYKMLNIFDSFLSSQEFYDSGALDDWMYETQGIPCYTMEFWDVASKAGVPINWGEKRKDDFAEDMKRFAAIMKWTKENAPQYYSDWKKIDHPYFGEVEVGGFNYKFTHQNPPENFLLNELENDTRFNMRFIRSLPVLVIEDVKSEKIADGIYKIEAIIANRGYLSSALTRNAVNIRKAKPVKVNIDAQTVSGANEIEIGELSGYSATKTGVFFYGNISTMQSGKSRKKVSFVIKAKPQDVITVKTQQIKAGKAEAKIIIE